MLHFNNRKSYFSLKKIRSTAKKTKAGVCESRTSRQLSNRSHFYDGGTKIQLKLPYFHNNYCQYPAWASIIGLSKWHRPHQNHHSCINSPSPK